MSRNNAGLSAERIITEALRIIDGQGLRRLTMRRLGDTLQVEAMAIYHHFPLGKEQLFDAIVEYVTDVTRNREPTEEPGRPSEDEQDGHAEETTENPPTDDRPWDERLRAWAHDYRAALLRHAGALPLLINRRPESVVAVRTLESHYAAFVEAGLSAQATVDAAAALDSYVTGSVIHQVRGEGLASPAPARLDGRFPTVVRLSQEAAPDPERSFSAGLDTLLAALIRDATPAR